MDSEELESLVVKLTGDGSQYARMLQDAQAQSVRAADEVAKAAARVESLGNTLLSFSKLVGASLVAFGIKDLVGESIEWFNKYEARQKDLMASVTEFNNMWKPKNRASDSDLEQRVKGYGAFIDEMRNSLGTSKETTAELLKQAEAEDLVGESAQNAVRDALALSGVLKVSADELLESTQWMHDDMFGGSADWVKYYLPQLKEIYGEEEQFAKAQELINEAFEAGTNRVKSLSEQLADTKEAIMSYVGPVIGNVATLLARLTAAFAEFVLQVKTRLFQAFGNIASFLGNWLRELLNDWTGGWLALEGSIFPSWERIQGTVTNVVNILTVILANFGKINKMALDAATAAWDKFSEGAGDAAGGLADIFKYLNKTLYDFWVNHEKLINSVVGVVAILAAAYAAYQLMNVAIAATVFLVGLLRLQQIASTALWLAQGAAMLVAKTAMLLWTGVVIVHTGVMTVFNATIAAVEFVVALLSGSFLAGAAAETAFSIATAAATAATWLLNAALTVLNAELLPVIVAAAIVSFFLLASAVIAVASAGAAVVATFQVVTKIFREIPGLISGTSGPIGEITSMFKEWNNILLAVSESVGVDMVLGFKILQAGVELAVSEIKDLWDPLWQFIAEGFSAISDLVAKEFKAKFLVASLETIRALVGVLDVWGLATKGMDKDLAKVHEAEAKRSQKDFAEAKERLEDALEFFDEVDHESEATRKTRKELEELLFDLEVAKLFQQDATEEQKKQTEQLQNQLNLKQALHNLDAVQYGSAAALRRIEEFRNLFDSGLQGSATGREGLNKGQGPRPWGGLGDFSNKKAEELRQFFVALDEAMPEEVAERRDWMPEEVAGQLGKWADFFKGAREAGVPRRKISADFAEATGLADAEKAAEYEAEFSAGREKEFAAETAMVDEEKRNAIWAEIRDLLKQMAERATREGEIIVTPADFD